MLSLTSQLAINNSSMFHSFVDSFFEGKKALVKERLMDSVRVVVDGLFEEMVKQVKEMMMPPKEATNGRSEDQVKPTVTMATPSIPAKTPTNLPPSQPAKANMIFATKSKPGPSTSAQQPFSGLYKRMAEEDGSSTHPKKKAITVELEIDDQFEDDDAGGNEDDDDDHRSVNGDVATYTDDEPAIPGGSKEKSSSSTRPNEQNKVLCPEPDCGKLLLARNIKRHLRTHSKVKPYSCTYAGCSLEFSQREHAIRHIQFVHLKNAEEGGGDEPPDPAAYLAVNEQLLL